MELTKVFWTGIKRPFSNLRFFLISLLFFIPIPYLSIITGLFLKEYPAACGGWVSFLKHETF